PRSRPGTTRPRRPGPATPAHPELSTAASTRPGPRRRRAGHRLASADEPVEPDGRQRAAEPVEEGQGDAELDRAQRRFAGPDDRPDLADLDHVRGPGPPDPPRQRDAPLAR